MPARINMSTVTFSGREVTTLRETFYQAIFAAVTLTQFHEIVEGIKGKQQIIYLGELGLSGKKITDCDITPNPNQIPASQKFWDPEYIGDRFEECFVTLLDTFWMWGLKNGLKKPDLTNTEFALFLEDRIAMAAANAVLRHAWLGSKNANLASAGGVLAAGTPLEYWNAIDGFWVQLAAIVAGDATKRVAIAKNAGASYAAQNFTAQDITDRTATNILEGLVYGADMRLREAPNKQIIVTQSLADQYVKERKAAPNSDVAYNRVEGGIATLQIDGIDIIPFSFLDRMIRTYENNGTKFNNPHRAVLTTKGNLQIGTEEVANLTELDPFYDKKDKVYIVDYAFNLDAKVAQDHLIMLAY